MNKKQKTDVIILEDDNRGLELIKLITIAKLHADVEVVSYATKQKNAGGIQR